MEVVQPYRRLVSSLLDRAAQAKPDKHIDPPLTEARLGGSIWSMEGADEDIVNRVAQSTRYSAVEIAFREKFYTILVCLHPSIHPKRRS